MSNYSIPESILYPVESRKELELLAAQLREELHPQNENEEELFERIVIAFWLKKRYEKVRSKLYDKKHSLDAESPQLAITTDSIRRFQQEVEHQKKQIAGLRKSLRRLRGGEIVSFEENLHEYLPAA